MRKAPLGLLGLLSFTTLQVNLRSQDCPNIAHSIYAVAAPPAVEMCPGSQFTLRVFIKSTEPVDGFGVALNSQVCATNNCFTWRIVTPVACRKGMGVPLNWEFACSFVPFGADWTVGALAARANDQGQPQAPLDAVAGIEVLQVDFEVYPLSEPLEVVSGPLVTSIGNVETHIVHGGQCVFPGDPCGEPLPEKPVLWIEPELSLALMTCPGNFIRGDCNLNGRVAGLVGDIIQLLRCLFEGKMAECTCVDACDANDDEVMNLDDVFYLINYLFRGQAAPPPPQACGPDPDSPNRACDTHPCP